MAAIRAGETVVETDGYDPRADEEAARLSHRRVAKVQDSYMTKAQLEDLRRVQNERIESGKMKQMGIQVSAKMGVRMDGSKFDKR